MAPRSVALDRMFRALADPSRRDIVTRLAQRPASIGELARRYPMSMSAVLQHLKLLEESGLVRSEKVGRVRTCRLDPRSLAAGDRWVTDQRARLQRLLDRLQADLESTRA